MLLNVKIGMDNKSVVPFLAICATGGLPRLWGALSYRQWRTVRKTANEERTQGGTYRYRLHRAAYYRDLRLRREFHLGWQHFTDCRCLRPRVHCRFRSFHSHIFSHPSDGRYEAEAEAEAEATEDGCIGDFQRSGTATPDNCARRRAVDAIRLPPANQRGELLRARRVLP
jgi:hypothetical protein